MTKQEKLDELADNILSANITPELAKQATQLVFGTGNPNSDVIFVGEAPGKNEDLRGLPFVGAAGKFLDEMLTSINIDRGKIYITNIIKYRPPNNRDPKPSEKKAFWPYLLKQIQVIQPKAIVTLGRHSGEAFIPNLHISADHGKKRRLKVIQDGQESSIVILPLYHPAAALYNGSLRDTSIKDFQIIKTFMNFRKN